VPAENPAAQVPGQLIPAGLLVTVPVPEAGGGTVNWYVERENPAEAVSAAIMEMLQADVPEQAPLQPVNV
jgi:hypothetical protein